MSGSENLVEVDGVSKRFCRSLKRSLFYGVQDVVREVAGQSLAGRPLRFNEFWANQDISFTLQRGECLGLIGANGAGKTTLLKILNGLIKPDEGEVRLYGRVGGIIALGAGFNPVLTGRENVMISGSVLGLSQAEMRDKFDEIVDFAEIGEFIDAPVQSYSSGMVVRLGFAVATAMEPDILLLDEVLAVGDAAFYAKCVQRVGTLMSKSAVIFVSHQAAQISRICDRCLWLKKGKAVALGPTEEVLGQYTKSLEVAVDEATVVVEPPLKSFEVTPKQQDCRWKEPLEITLVIESEAEVLLGPSEWVVRANLVPIAYGELFPQSHRLVRGVNRIPLRIENVLLREGMFSFSVNLTDASGKRYLVIATDVGEFKVLDGVIGKPYHRMIVHS